MVNNRLRLAAAPSRGDGKTITLVADSPPRRQRSLKLLKSLLRIRLEFGENTDRPANLSFKALC
jgi:hypothetical protein